MKKLLSIRWCITILLVILVILAPLGISGYWLRFLTFIFLWIGLAGSLNLVTGYTGYLDFGHVGFFGIGSYITGIMMLKLNAPFFLAMLIGAILAGIVAIVVGVPTMKLRGVYFAIAMLAFSEAMKQVTLELEGITGGGNGLSLPIYTNYYFFYYLMLLAVLLMTATTYWFERSKFGLGLMAIREAELAAEVSGINTFYCKLTAFGISAFFAGVIGGIYAYWMTFIYPGDVFNVMTTVHMVIMTFLGGAGTLLGPIVGATLLAAIEELLWAEFKYTYLIIMGFIVVFVVLVMPRGVVGVVRERYLAR